MVVLRGVSHDAGWGALGLCAHDQARAAHLPVSGSINLYSMYLLVPSPVKSCTSLHISSEMVCVIVPVRATHLPLSGLINLLFAPFYALVSSPLSLSTSVGRIRKPVFSSCKSFISLSISQCNLLVCDKVYWLVCDYWSVRQICQLVCLLVCLLFCS